MTQQRYHGLDFVRATAMLLGVIIHITIFFVPAGTYVYWGTGEYNGDPVNLILTELIHVFRMQLFFIMAGFFAELVIEHKGLKHLVKDRLKRILVPFVVGVLVLLPVHSLLINLIGTFSDYHSWYGDHLVDMSLLEQVTAVAFFGTFADETFQNDGLMHLWFLYYLLIIYALHLVLRITCKPLFDNTINSFGKVFCFAMSRKYRILLLGLISFPFQYSLTSVFFWPTGLNAPPNHLAFYFLFYIAGIVLYQNRYLLDKVASYGWFYLIVSIPFALYIYEPSQRVDDSASIIRDITHWSVLDLSEGRVTGFKLWPEGIFHNGWSKMLVVFVRAQLCWALCLAFIGLAHKYLNRPSPIVRYLADSAYWVYWIHLPITFFISKHFQQMGYVNSLIRSYLVLVISVAIIYWSYNTFVRYSLLGDYFMGRRKDKRQPEEQSFTMVLMTKKLLLRVTVIGGFVALLGMVLEFNNSFHDKGLLVEAFAARKESLLRSAKTIDGVVDRYGNTPLHSAVRRTERGRRYEPLPLLLEKTDRYNDRNDYGRTALFTAVRMGNREDVAKLVDAGANLNIPDKYGHTPAHVAAVKTGLTNRKKSEHFFSILQLLVQHGADLQLKDYRGRTVVDCLQYFGGRSLDEQ